MKFLSLALLLAFVTPITFGAKAVLTYRDKEYDIIGAKNDSVIIRVGNQSKKLKPEAIRIVDDAANQLTGVTADLNNLLVTLQPKGTRVLIVEADIKIPTDLTDCFLILVSGSSNDVSTVARALPDFSANEPMKISFAIKTRKFTKMEPYKLCLFSGGKSIVLKNGDSIQNGRITPYDQMPRALFQVDSVFPESLKNQFAQAKVMMEFRIGADGKISETKALESPHELFTKSAIESLEKSRFAPRYSKGIPKSTRIKQAIVFRNQKPVVEIAQ